MRKAINTMKKKLKIAMVMPSFAETGGPEVAVKNLVDALLEKGVDVTLFAPADWRTKAKHIPTIYKSLKNIKNLYNQPEQIETNLMIESQLKVLKYREKFDIIHINLQGYAATLARLAGKPCVLTFHSEINALNFRQIRESGISTVALSHRHREGMPVSVVIENGINTKKINYSFEKGNYLITIGRLTESKGIEDAIKIAKKANKKLLIFGRIGFSEKRRRYFNKKIKPLLGDKIIYKGEVSQHKIFYYLKRAEALLFPIVKLNGKPLFICPLVVMESLACGTPVIGTPIKPLPKPLQDPKIACVSKNLNILIKAAENTDQFDRQKCREFAEKYFDNSIMADKYIKLYEKLVPGKHA
jgi:glycosyltransferase involved in cell wall biosynthesis